MNTLTIEQIAGLQKQYGFTDIQDKINTGMAWQLEGSVGRYAMNCLESGACMLPEISNKDYYGNTVPPRTVLQAGTKGTLENSQKFWQGVLDGEIELEIEE